MTSKVNCKRNTAYLEGGAAVRKNMEFDCPGPLVAAHQTVLVELLRDLERVHFQNKPAHLRTYEYDVLYPEVNTIPGPEIPFR
jgi:hypothetical protein